MTAHSQSIKIIQTELTIQLFWNSSPFHIDKIIPLLSQAIQEGHHIEIFIEKDGRVELDMYFVKPDFSKISSFIKSYPKIKLYKSFYYFIEPQK